MVRVLIERRIAPGQDEDFRRLAADMRRKAVQTAGYVSGETLRDSADPTHYVVVSTWTSRARWESWMKGEARRRMDAALMPLLAEPEKITVLEHI